LLGLHFGLPEKLGVLLFDGLLKIAVKPLHIHALFIQIDKALAADFGMRVLHPHPNFLNPSIHDALRATQLGMLARAGSARFKRCE